MTTINEVAKRSGVAPITVSRVINNSGYVTQPVRDRVQSAIVELGYVPNILARSLRSRRTNTLALIVTDLTNPFFTAVARGVQDAAGSAGYIVLLGNSDEQEDKETDYVRMILQRQVDGILLVPASAGQKSIATIRAQKTPVVVLDRRVAVSDVDTVRCDCELAAYKLGKLIVSLGHRNAAILTGSQDLSIYEDRTLGFRRALLEAGVVSLPPVLEGTLAPIYQGSETQSAGYAITRKVLTEDPRPTVIFAANNFLAVGAQQAIRDSGLRVPEDVALVAFDDIPPSFVADPFLTVVHQPAYEMGKRGLELLLQRIEEKEPTPSTELLLETELIIRRSSGASIT